MTTIWALMLALGWNCTGRADDEVQVTTTLAADSTEVGEEVDMTVKVAGSTEAQAPENVNVDGLTITCMGSAPQVQIEMGTGFGGGRFERSVTFTYSVVPQRAGVFVIPPQEVVVDGNTYTTQAVTLNVGNGGAGGIAGGGGNGGGGGSGSGQGGGQLYYAEIVPAQDTAYVGQAIPMEIRLYVDQRVRGQLEELPELKAEGFTMQKIGKPEQGQTMQNGRGYAMLTYKTAVTPAKAGKLELGPVTVQAEAHLPMRQRQRPQGIYGNPIFSDPFFQNPFGDEFEQLSPPQQITISGPAVELTARPVPARGQPASFGGAVGTFTMTVSAKPLMVEAGDPITITASISGHGDFDRVTAPQVTDEHGWRIYPPAGKFDADDESQMSGTKTFEIAAIPEPGITQSPDLEWSYFDPIKEQYVTLHGKGSPIKVEGGAPPPPAPVAAAGTPAAGTGGGAGPAPAQAPTPATADIAYIRADSEGWRESVEPVYRTPAFWMAQGAPLAALAGLLAYRSARRRAADAAARARAQWKREKEAAMGMIQRKDATEGEVYAAAVRALRLEAAMQTGRAPETLDVAEVMGLRALEEGLAARVRRLFDQQAEALYAGTAGGRKAATAQLRVEVLETVKGYENAKPNS